MEIVRSSELKSRGIKDLTSLRYNSSICNTDRELLNDIVDAFLNNDLANIIELEQSLNGLVWYKHLKKGALKKINPIQSNIMGQLLEAKIDLLWKDMELTDVDNDFISVDLIRKIERFVQMYGQIVLRLSYVNGELKHKFFNNNFNYKRNNFNEIEYIETWEYYEHEGKEYTLSQVENNGVLNIKLYDQQDKEVALSTIPALADLSSEIVLQHKLHFVFSNERNLTQIINVANTIDMNLSNIDYITMRGLPFILVNQSMAMRNMKSSGVAGLDEENIEYQLTDMRDFTVSNTQDGTLQAPVELKSPSIDLKPFQDSVDYLVGVAANTMGLSAISLGSNIVSTSANTSAEGLKERTVLTDRTKTSERAQRIEELQLLFESIGSTTKIVINDQEETIDTNLLAVLKDLQQTGLISWEQLIKELKPNWGRAEIELEKLRMRQDKLLGISFTKPID